MVLQHFFWTPAIRVNESLQFNPQNLTFWIFLTGIKPVFDCGGAAGERKQSFSLLDDGFGLH
jgi:hypothetical protein